MPRLLPFLFLLPTLLCTAAAHGQDKPPKIFSDESVYEVRIEAPWSAIARQKERERSWEGRFRYSDRDGRAIDIPVTITTRGLTRLRVCDFPPLRLDFDKEAAKGTAFRGAGNLKMVTHCFRGSKFEQYYVKEYLSYRMYNRITERSYRVQGLDVSYAKDADDKRPLERFAFLVEDPDDVAKRNGLQKLDIDETVPSELDPRETARFTLFQYLIANLDWSALGGPKPRCCHNARLIGTAPGQPPYIPIPYDLDSSGLVDAHYAAPPEGVRARNVRQRIYRGFCAHNDELPAVLDEFRALRPEFEALFENESRLDARPRGDALRFIGQFYGTLEDPGDVQRLLIDNCRG
ncbi:MAG: hypothetical protein P8008_07225 [Gammaproteobacteria bacterium]